MERIMCYIILAKRSSANLYRCKTTQKKIQELDLADIEGTAKLHLGQIRAKTIKFDLLS